jgi:arylsulfatase A-like enzyme
MNFFIRNLFVVFIVFGVSGVQASADRERPNIIFIMTDDHTKQAMSAYGGELLHTPNLDKIANEGIRFDKSYVTNAICAPSRAVALTGKYSHINGVKDNRDIFNGKQNTFPKLLQSAGYQTYMIGKWHLKSDPTGFDYWNILPHQGEYYNPHFRSAKGKKQYEGYVTNIVTDFAISAIDERDTSKPFAMVYSHKAPHRNWMPSPEDVGAFNDVEFPLPDNFFDDYKNRASAAKNQDMEIIDMFSSFDMKLHVDKETNTGGNPNWDAVSEWRQIYEGMTKGQRKAWDEAYQEDNKRFEEQNLKGAELAIWKYQRYMRDYLLTVKSVDDNVGRLLKYLDANGLSDNTVIMYTSDQGFYLGEHGWFDKRFMYEESFGMPLAIRYPQMIKPHSVSSQLVANIDIAPTLLDLAGVAIPDDIQGRSLVPLWSEPGPDAEPWRSSIYYHYYEYPHGWHSVQPHRGVRTDRYKLIHYYKINEWELFDLQADPSEMKSVYADPAYASVKAQMLKELRRQTSAYKDDQFK